MDEAIYSWVRDHEQITEAHDLDKSCISLGGSPPLWSKPRNTEAVSHPGYDFFLKPPITISRQYLYPIPEDKTRIQPNQDFFNFEAPVTENSRGKSINEMIDESPPIFSIFPKSSVVSMKDERQDIGIINPDQINQIMYLSAQFCSLKSSVVIVEPIIINVFLYSIDQNKQITETWRYLPIETRINASIDSLIYKSILDASDKFRIPCGSQPSRVVFVVFLDHLLIQDGNTLMEKYLSKPNVSTTKAVQSALKNCGQPYSSTTFAWTSVPFNTLQTKTDAKEITFDQFLPTSTVSEEFLALQFSDTILKPKEKYLPFSVSFIFSNINEGYNLRHYLALPPLPYLSFINELIIHVKTARFKFPRGIRGRNIVLSFSLESGGVLLPVFRDGEYYITRCQYHVESPSFHDDIVVFLPTKMEKDAILRIQFFHASVKEKAKEKLEFCGIGSLPLFNPNGAFIESGIHDIGISYNPQEKFVEPSEVNRAVIDISLHSCLYSSDSQITKLHKGDFTSIGAIDEKEKMKHIFFLLDTVILGISNGIYDAFLAFMVVLRGFSNDRNMPDSQKLSYYSKFCALRDEGYSSFYSNCVAFWTKYLETSSFEKKRPDIFCSWFLFELIIKAILRFPVEDEELRRLFELNTKLVALLSKFRVDGPAIGLTLNSSLLFFYKDLIEISNIKLPYQMIFEYLKVLQLEKNKNDRTCFRAMFNHLLTPKVFLFALVRISHENSFFADFICPKIKEAISNEYHSGLVFKALCELLVHFSFEEHRILAVLLVPIIEIIGESYDILMGYHNWMNLVHIIAIVHFVFRFVPPNNDLKHHFVRSIDLLMKRAKHLTKEDILNLQETSKKVQNAEDMTQEMTRGLKKDNIVGSDEIDSAAAKTRRHASLNLKKGMSFLPKATDNDQDLGKKFDALSFCSQTVLITYISKYNSVDVVNSIIAAFFDIPLSPYLIRPFFDSVKEFAKLHPETFFGRKMIRTLKSVDDLQSQKEEQINCEKVLPNIKHIIRHTIKKLDPIGLDLIESLYMSEEEYYHTINRTSALVCRALQKCPPTLQIKELTSTSERLKSLVTRLYEINSDLENPQLQTENPDMIASLLFEKASLLSPSPDSRVEVLLQLAEHNVKNRYKSEAVMAQLSAAALVVEYMTILGKIPAHLFPSSHPAIDFEGACPSASAEICPESVMKDLPFMPGYCTSKYFTEFGLIYLIQNSMETCKVAALFELSTRIHSLLGPIASRRRLWRVLQKHYITGSLSWSIAAKLYTSSDRMLGSYYKVQFQDIGVFIYRETELSNLWQVIDKLQKSSQYFSKGKPVQVITEGEELNESNLDKEKYYVHIKFVNQYFTPEENKKRVTVFEKNHNITQFYFDLPLSKSSQAGMEDCRLKRTIITIPHPLPYLINRVKVPKGGITTQIFSPIEYACQNLQRQVSLITEACAKQSFKELQPLLQGSLLVQVNEGPAKIAEVFLSRSNDEEHTSQLRRIFRDFLEIVRRALKLHGEYVYKNPIFGVLQEELELGLSKLTSTLQQYLK